MYALHIKCAQKWKFILYNNYKANNMFFTKLVLTLLEANFNCA